MENASKLRETESVSPIIKAVQQVTEVTLDIQKKLACLEEGLGFILSPLGPKDDEVVPEEETKCQLEADILHITR